MDSKSKLQSFHASIRKGHHDSFFEKKRIKILEHLEKKQKMMEEQFEPINNSINLTLNDLIKAAKFSQSESGIRALKIADYQTIVLKYLGEEYINSDQQFFASYILCNLFFIRQAPPNQEMTKRILHLMKNGDIRTIQNCLSILQHVLLDFPEWRNHVVKEQGLVDKLRHLFMVPQPSKKYLQTLLMVVHRTLYKAPAHDSFKNIKKPLCQIIMNIQTEDFDILKIAMHSLHIISIAYPEDTGKFITQAAIIPRLINIIFTLNDKGLTFITLELIKASLSTITAKLFTQKVVPFIRELEQRKYEIGNINSAFSTIRIQKLAYNIINQALETGKLEAETFFNDLLAFLLLQVMQVADDKEIIDFLIRIFSIVLLNIRSQSAKVKIDQAFQKIRENYSDNFSIMAYLKQIDGLRDHI